MIMANKKKSIAYFRIALHNDNCNINKSGELDNVYNNSIQQQQQQERAEKVFYVKTLWKIDSLNDLSYPDNKVACDLTVTDCKLFWTKTGRINYKLLFNIKNRIILIINH